MRCYFIKDDSVTVLPAAPASAPVEGVVIARASELDSKRFPIERLLRIHNSLPGITTAKSLGARPKALKTFWSALEKLPLGSARNDSKQALVVRLLQRREGCDMAGLIKATGWQSHSIRGVMSGALKKRLGLAIESTKVDGRRVYRIA
jgi:hypothetical protein